MNTNCLICRHGPQAAAIADEALAGGLSQSEVRSALKRAGIAVSSWAVQMHARHRDTEPPPTAPIEEEKPATPIDRLEIIERQPMHPRGLRDLIKSLAEQLEVLQRNQLVIVQKLQEQVLVGNKVSTKDEVSSLKTLDALLRNLREFREAELSIPVDVRVVLPSIQSADDIATGLQLVTDAAISGRITHAEAKLLADLLGRQGEALKLRYFEHKLRQLEAKVIESRAGPVLSGETTDAS